MSGSHLETKGAKNEKASSVPAAYPVSEENKKCKSSNKAARKRASPNQHRNADNKDGDDGDDGDDRERDVGGGDDDDDDDDDDENENDDDDSAKRRKSRSKTAQAKKKKYNAACAITWPKCLQEFVWTPRAQPLAAHRRVVERAKLLAQQQAALDKCQQLFDGVKLVFIERWPPTRLHEFQSSLVSMNVFVDQPRDQPRSLDSTTGLLLVPWNFEAVASRRALLDLKDLAELQDLVLVSEDFVHQSVQQARVLPLRSFLLARARPASALEARVCTRLDGNQTLFITRLQHELLTKATGPPPGRTDTCIGGGASSSRCILPISQPKPSACPGAAAGPSPKNTTDKPVTVALESHRPKPESLQFDKP